MQNDPTTTFADALEALLDENQELNHELLQHFSDISHENLNALIKIWGKLSTTRKQNFLYALKKDLETNILLSFDSIARYMLKDDDEFVRTISIRLLSDYEGEDIIPALLIIATKDAVNEPRAEAITALGKYVLKGELDEISQSQHKKIEERLLDIYHNAAQTNLRQRALESLGFSSRKEIIPLIREAWSHASPMWKASAILAMGRSYDQQWATEVLEGLVHEHEIIRFAATKAAGELALQTARPILLDHLLESQDEIVFQAIIWSLSQIGGEDVRDYFLSLIDQYDEDDEQVDFIEEALENLDFTEETQDFDMFNFTPEDIFENDERGN